MYILGRVVVNLTLRDGLWIRSSPGVARLVAPVTAFRPGRWVILGPNNVPKAWRFRSAGARLDRCPQRGPNMTGLNPNSMQTAPKLPLCDYNILELFTDFFVVFKCTSTYVSRRT
jgi:hypothetical protein